MKNYHMFISRCDADEIEIRYITHDNLISFYDGNVDVESLSPTTTYERCVEIHRIMKSVWVEEE